MRLPKKAHDWNHMGWLTTGEEVSQCQRESCRKWYFSNNPVNLITDARFRKAFAEISWDAQQYLGAGHDGTLFRRRV